MRCLDANGRSLRRRCVLGCLQGAVHFRGRAVTLRRIRLTSLEDDGVQRKKIRRISRSTRVVAISGK